jgi:DNA-binding MarR family transcriptional regulator
MKTDFDDLQLVVLSEALKTIEQELTLPLMICLVSIAKKPGISVNDLASDVGIPQQTASRYIAILLGRYQSATPQYDSLAGNPLVSLEVSAEDPRRRALYLTKRGKLVLKKLTDKLVRLGDR